MLLKIAHNTPRDNPNPKANIGFLSYVPFNFYVYKNIYKHLPNAEFVIGENYDEVRGIGNASNTLDNVIGFFSSKPDIYWRYYDSHSQDYSPKEFFDKYGILVSTWPFTPLLKSYNLEKKLARVMYGHAKDPWNYGLWSAYFDLILSYGKYSHDRLSIYNNSFMAGNPKFDDWFSNSIDEKEIENLRRKLDTGKKTILFLPTMGALSIMDNMATALNIASQNYNIIIKVHHNTFLYEQDRLRTYRENNSILFKSDRDDLLPLLKVSDLVLGDNSGAIFDAILANKPVVLIDFLDNSFFKIHAEKLIAKIYRKKTGGVATAPDSIEQLIKRPDEEIGPIIRIPYRWMIKNAQQIPYAYLKEALKDAEQNEEIYKVRRQKIRELSFAYNDGNCGKRAAEKITELLYTPKLPDSFIKTLVIKYGESYRERQAIKIKSLRQKKRVRIMAARKYMHIKSLPFPKRIPAIFKEFF